jgi:hypothetical protein
MATMEGNANNLKPVLHLRIFSREANFSFVFGLSTGTIWNYLDKDKRKFRFARKNSQVEHRLYVRGEKA